MTTTRWVDPATTTCSSGVTITPRSLIAADTATSIQRTLRWITELVDFQHRADDTLGRSTVTDAELITATRALADTARLTLGTGPTGEEVEHAVRTLLGVLAGDPEAYRDDVDPDDVLTT